MSVKRKKNRVPWFAGRKASRKRRGATVKKRKGEKMVRKHNTGKRSS